MFNRFDLFMKLFKKLKEKTKTLKTEIIAISFSMHDSRTPILAKIMVVITIGYALSPIDFIPDFIPILGYLDDLIILPFMIATCIKLIPQKVLEESRIKAKEKNQVNRILGIYAAIIIILFWITVIGFIASKLTR